MATRDKALKEGMNVQSAILDVGMVEDVTAAEVTAHQGLIDALNAKLTEEGTVQANHGEASVQNGLLWGGLYQLSKEVKEIAVAKAPSDAIKEVMEKVDPGDGFNVTRARSLARQLQGALGRYPETFKAKRKTKAEILASLDEGITSDKALSDQLSALRGIQGEIRALVKQLDEESDRILTILENNFDEGSPERAVIDRARVRRRATTKKVTEQPEENK